MPRIALAVCTYQRNDALVDLLESVLAAAAETPGAEVGVVVVDDNADGRAEPIAERYAPKFALGVEYRKSGQANISIARNLGLEGAIEMADWVAMTDDDCIVPVDWFLEHLRAQAVHDADATTGTMRLTFPEDGPGWIREQPFDQIGIMALPDQTEMERCATNNSMVRAAWLRAHPEIRFDPSLGKTGGEDMVFYRAAVNAGLRARFAASAPVFEIEPLSRATFRYQLSRSLWMGNTEAVTNIRSGDASRARLARRSLVRGVRSIVRPFTRLVARETPQWRYALAAGAGAVGLLVGALGKELTHR